jgi:type I restriction enzyme S subunit
MSEWKKCKLEDVAEIVGGGTPKTEVPEYWNGNIPWLTPRDLSNYSGRYISNGERNISKVGLKNSSAKILPKGTVLLSSRAPVGYLVIALNEMSTNQGFRSLIPNLKTNSLFLFYLLKNNVDYLKSQSTGTTFSELAGSTLKSLSFLFPPLPAQRAIASILSSLDDKIDLLHRQNKTLETMAETLFRQWFMEEAKEDWEKVLLGNIAKVQNGYAFSSRDYVKYQINHLEVFKMGHIKPGGGLRYSPKTDFVPRSEKLKKWILSEGDIVMAMTDMKDSMGILGHPAMIDMNDTYVLNQRVARIYLNSNKILINNYFLYLQLKTDTAIAIIQSKAHGGVQVNLSTESIRSIPIIIPPKQKQENGLKLLEGYFLNSINNRRQINTLEKLRDTLLPKLMSGEVWVQYDKEATI